jgi:hypothetical protein
MSGFLTEHYTASYRVSLIVRLWFEKRLHLFLNVSGFLDRNNNHYKRNYFLLAYFINTCHPPRGSIGATICNQKHPEFSENITIYTLEPASTTRLILAAINFKQHLFTDPGMGHMFITLCRPQPTCPVHSSIISLMVLKYLAKSTNHKVSHCTVFFLLYPSHVPKYCAQHNVL